MQDPPSVGAIVDDEFDAILGVPDPTDVSQGAGANSITAASWADLPSYTCDNTITNPSDTYTLLCEVHFGAFLATSSTDVRCSIASNGGDVAFTAAPGGGGITSWGQALWNTTASAANSQRSMFTIEIPASGTLNIKMQAYRPSGSSASVNYPWTQIVPLRYI